MPGSQVIVNTSGRRPPNTRVQRTRSSPSAPHSPLTRCPLGANRWYPARGKSSVLGSRARLCTPRASAMRADECGEWARAAVWQGLERGDSTLQKSARPPAQAASAGALVPSRRAKQNRASRRSTRSRPWRVGGVVACNPNCDRAPNTRMKLQAQ